MEDVGTEETSVVTTQFYEKEKQETRNIDCMYCMSM